jgi:hypothetical protein
LFLDGGGRDCYQGGAGVGGLCPEDEVRDILWMSAFTAIRICPASRVYYETKRADGKHHRQAVLALARRRVDVLWALIRDHKTYQPATA